jgi:hypothetical protein
MTGITLKKGRGISILWLVINCIIWKYDPASFTWSSLILIRLSLEDYIRLPYFIIKNVISASQKTHYLSITTTNWLILFRAVTAVYCEHHTKLESIQSAKYSIYNVKADGTYTYYCDLKSWHATNLRYYTYHRRLWFWAEEFIKENNRKTMHLACSLCL